MLTYSLNFRKDTERINSKVSKTSNGKQCYYQNASYVITKNQDLSGGLLRSLGIQTPLSKIPFLCNILLII